MSEPFIGEIRLVGFTFAPQGWAFCDGQLLPISQNDALFSILGTTYGGDGVTTFGLPDLRGRVPIHAGSGPSLPTYRLGEAGGVEANSLSLAASASPVAHVHPYRSAGAAATSAPETTFATTTTVAESAPPQTLDNMQPWLGIHFVIALFGIYPTPT